MFNKLKGTARIEYSAKHGEYYAYDDNHFICGTNGFNKDKLEEMVKRSNEYEAQQQEIESLKNNLDTARKASAEQWEENEKLKTELNDLHLHTLNMENGKIDMTVSGENARLWFASIVQIFKQNGGVNFLCQTLQAKNGNEKYAVTIQNCNGELTPAEKMEKMQQEINILRELLPESIPDLSKIAENSEGNIISHKCDKCDAVLANNNLYEALKQTDEENKKLKKLIEEAAEENEQLKIENKRLFEERELAQLEAVKIYQICPYWDRDGNSKCFDWLKDCLGADGCPKICPRYKADKE